MKYRHQETLYEDSGQGRPPRTEHGTKPVSFRLDCLAWTRLLILRQRRGGSMREVIEDLLLHAVSDKVAYRERASDLHVDVRREEQKIFLEITLPGGPFPGDIIT